MQNTCSVLERKICHSVTPHNNSNEFMFNFRYPFNDSEHASLFAKISRGHFIIPDCLSSRARCLIRSLLRREPSERITSEDVLHHPWFSQGDRESHSSLQASRQCDQLVPSMPSTCNWDESDVNDD